MNFILAEKNIKKNGEVNTRSKQNNTKNDFNKRQIKQV